MRLLTYVLKSITLLNLLLFAAAASLTVYVLFPLLNMKVSYKPPAVKETPAVQEEKPAAAQSTPLSDYMVVAEQNLFHPERKIPAEGKEQQPLPKPEIFLYGTLITDDVRLAYIEDRKSPQSSPGRGKRQSVVKQGNTVSGFLLQSVETDRIVLVRGEEQMIVYLDDAQKPREAATSPQTAATQPTPRPGAPGGTSAAITSPAGSPTAAQTQPQARVPTSGQLRQLRSPDGRPTPPVTGQSGSK